MPSSPLTQLSFRQRFNLMDQLMALYTEQDRAGLVALTSRMAEQEYAAAWHSARLRFVQKYWREDDLSPLVWLRAEMGPSLWKGLTIPSWWTLNKKDALQETRLGWHREMLHFNDSRGVFKGDPGAIALLEETPKLSWLIAAMQGDKPRASPFLDTYFPGAFAYHQLLQTMQDKPMDNPSFSGWILEGKHPGFAEMLENIDADLFGAGS